MDKNAIKKYAVWARRELISRVSQRAALYEITDKGYGDASADSVLGRIMSSEEKQQRQALIAQIREKGYEQVMEEVAYTWFNRFAALRFMEVNGYLPSHVRMFTNDEGAFKPQILAEAIHLDLDGLNMDKVYELKNANKEEELFKYLLIVQCNALNKILPGMFQKIEDFTELLLPDNLLRDGSVIQQMIALIPEQDWTDQVQIIGWLYQYYNTEPKDKVFADLKKNIKITKENIPAATQLFTPDWIVRYMVENSLGRLWLEGHPNDALKSEWKYYLDEAEQEEDVQRQLDVIRKEYAALKPEDIRCIDPCMGSGHILCYMFDILVRIYEDYGYTAREAVVGIIENNLWGLDIDERAAQLAYFAVMMKARQYDRRFFHKKDEDGNLAIPQPHVYTIEESNHLDSFALDYFCDNRSELTKAMQTIIKELHDAKEYGSILTVTPQDWSALYARFDEVEQDISMHRDVTLQQLKPLVQVAQALAQKYQAVVTNPPYMGSSNMSGRLSDYVKKNYPDSKSDLFAVFIERCGQLVAKNCYQAMITQHAWMFLSSFEKLRKKLQKVDTINMAHLGARAFDEISGEVVQTVTFSLRMSDIKHYKGKYIRLVDVGSQSEKEKSFLSGKYRYNVSKDVYFLVPGHRIAYWLDANKIFNHGLIGEYFVSGGRNKTHNNELYVRNWWEIGDSKYKWRHYDNGGNSRKWYGNCQDIVNWSESAKAFYAKHGGLLRDEICDKTGISWNGISGSKYCFKFKQAGFSFSSSSPTIITEDSKILYGILGLLNSCIAPYILNAINPTLQLNVGEVLNFPVVKATEVSISLSQANIKNAKTDWDSFETSWDFQRHPLV